VKNAHRRAGRRLAKDEEGSRGVRDTMSKRRSLRGKKGRSRPEGLFGADSSVPVTNQINGKNLIELAVENFGEQPVVWGRYFTSAGTSGLVEYRHLRENQILRDAGIRVVPIARQTKHVMGHKTKAAQMRN
jgi:hypothetical protein